MATVRNSAKAIIVRDGKLLCIEHADSDGPYYTLPGGGQEFGETLTDALKRECQEELSVDVEVGELLFIREYLSSRHEFAATSPDLHRVEFLFLCRFDVSLDCKPGANPDSSQIGIIWLPLDKLRTSRFYPAALKDKIAGCSDNCPRQPVYLGDVN